MRSWMRVFLAAPFLAGAAVWADESEIEEVVVVAEQHKRVFELAETLDVAPDSAAILRRAVGANVVSNGPLTGIAQYRGMSRFRVSTQVNGAVISSGGPNWMDPPLSYAPAAHLESLEVYRGITSVSAGLETIGGAIKANTWQGSFSESGTAVSGRIRTGTQTNNNGALYSGAVVVANERQLLKLSGLHESGDDAEFADGDILPTEYTRDRFDLGYGLRAGKHTFRFDYGRSDTGDAGTPALPMDIAYIDADLFSLTWQYAGERVVVNTKVHSSDIDHGMTNYHLRNAPMSAGMWRRNIASGDNLGFAVTAEWGDWKVGLDGHRERHDSDIDNPNNPMFFVTNFNNAERELLGLFVERETLFADNWLVELGVRANRVAMDADEVNATPAMMGMPAAVALRDRFNAADRSQDDTNVDWVAKINYLVTPRLSYYLGLSRKSRSPAYQERYLWLPLQATAGLADGRTYTGNVELDPEVAHELELGIDWQSDRFEIAPRVFYRDVEDYIQGTASANLPAMMFVQMMNTMNGSNNAVPLEFNNVDAKLYGLDVDWRYQLTDAWSFNGVLNLVRGERDDIDDDLYRVAAPNAFVAANYTRPNWGLSVEGFFYHEQDDVSRTNSETPTSGYSVFNVKGYVSLADGLRLGIGVDNLTDKVYADHLGGVNRVRGNTDVAVGERLPSYGRSVFARLDYRW